MIKRRKNIISFLLLFSMLVCCFTGSAQQKTAVPHINILFAISDDQSYPHASAYGQKIFQTPVFDSIAANGILFTNAFVAAPQCSPSRAAILTGRHIWQLEEAGTHASLFPDKFPVFTDALERSGYFIGYTGKPWDPGNFQAGGWKRNPVGPEYNARKLRSTPTTGISKTDYVANFQDFLSAKPDAQPFFFWFGAQEPHRNYEEGSGAAVGLSPDSIEVPSFLPDQGLVRNDMLDYALEIRWFDTQLGKMLQLLKERGELANTVVVVTSDNGMPFPYAKANLQEYGIHVPLAVCGPVVTGKHRKIDDLISLTDLAPTFLDIAQVDHFKGITGKTLLPLFSGSRSGVVDPSRSFVLAGRERHSHARPDNLGYPARAIRTARYLLIENFKTDRWPLGDPAPLDPKPVTDKTDMKPILEGYEDIDDSPTKSFIIRNRKLYPDLFQLGFAKREQVELYDISKDPDCMHDLSNDSALKKVRDSLKKRLEQELTMQGDPRMNGRGDLFDSYPRFGLMRPFDGFKERGKYNPAYQKK